MQAERAAHLSRNLLDFARAQVRSHGPVALNDVVRQTLEIAADTGGGTVTLGLDLALELPHILGSVQELQQVLINLLTNARQAIHASGVGTCLTVRTCVNPAGGVRLSVCDDGPGIPVEHRERLFEPFFTTKEAGEGTGLGLSICLGILRTHGASLDLESEMGKGTSFHIDFPVLEQESAVSVVAETSPGKSVAVSGVGAEAGAVSDGLESGARECGRWRALVVDDEPYIRELLIEMLGEMEIEAVGADSPIVALDLLEAGWFDVILSDVKMPEMSGMAFFEQVRASNPEQARRTIFLTGDMLAPGTQAFNANKGVLCLGKPFQHAMLEQKLLELRGRP